MSVCEERENSKSSGFGQIMKSKIASSRLVLAGFPTAFTLAVAWLGVTLVRNEKNLLMRRLELETELEEKSRGNRRKSLIGK